MTTPRAWMEKFWDNQRAMGRKPAKVFAIHTERNMILGWSVNRGAAEKEMGRYGECHGTLRIVEHKP